MNGEFAQKLKRILQDVCEKTGVEVSLTPFGGDETKVPLEYCGERAEGYLKGSGDKVEQAAKLVSYLVANSDHAPLPDKQDALREILLGEGTSWNAFRFLTKHNLADGVCFAVDMVPEKRLFEALTHVEGCLEGQDMVVRMDDQRLAIVKFLDEGQSPYEFGVFLAQSLYEELGIKASVGVGCEGKSFSEIALSYSQAATAVRMSSIFHAEGEVHSYREYLLVRMLGDLPEAKWQEYIDQFRISEAAEVFEDEDMTDTAEAFLESSLNVSETSRKLFMHRNTLMYRLDKIERITGLNIRKFSDAVTFRVITILYKLLRR